MKKYLGSIALYVVALVPWAHAEDVANLKEVSGEIAAEGKPQVMAVGGEAPESLLVDLTDGEVTMGDALLKSGIDLSQVTGPARDRSPFLFEVRSKESITLHRTFGEITLLRGLPARADSALLVWNFAEGNSPEEFKLEEVAIQRAIQSKSPGIYRYLLELAERKMRYDEWMHGGGTRDPQQEENYLRREAIRIVDMGEGRALLDAFAATRDFSLKSVVPSMESEDRFAKTLEELLASRSKSE